MHRLHRGVTCRRVEQDPIGEPYHRVGVALRHPVGQRRQARDAEIAQAAAEAALTLFSTTFRGANLIQNLGYLDSAMTGSFELIVFCHEIIGWLKSFLRPLRVDDEALALEVIDQAGPEGNFLTTEHTFKHYLEDWKPGLWDRSSYSQWEKKGSRDLQARANALARDLVGKPPAAPLPPRTLARLRAML